MATITTHPTPTVQQVSGYNPEMRPILSVLAKKTYHIMPDGHCVPSEDQLPLVLDVEYDPNCKGRLIHDLDIFPMKPATDVVIQGHCYAPSSNERVTTASIHIGERETNLLVIGERQCMISSTGRIIFSDPRPFEKIPLRYDRAYGGRDAVAEKKYGNPYEGLRKYLPESTDISYASPFSYPRNPCGKGYLLEATHDAVAKLQLPNLEDPDYRLTPEQIAVNDLGRWPLMPLPRSTDWVDHLWFPRIVYFGIIPAHGPLEGPISEVFRGWAPPDLMTPGDQTKKFSFRFTNGASLGLQFTYLKGNETCELLNMHPKYSRFRFRLPNSCPKIWTDGRNGKLNETKPIMQSVIIEPDSDRLSVVWSGCAPALRPYMQEELEEMPLRVEW